MLPANTFSMQALKPFRVNEWRRRVIGLSEELIILDKPPWTVTHSSEFGPLYSAVGTTREAIGKTKVYPVGRLDLETSGILLLGTSKSIASRLEVSAVNPIGCLGMIELLVLNRLQRSPGVSENSMWRFAEVLYRKMPNHSSLPGELGHIVIRR